MVGWLIENGDGMMFKIQWFNPIYQQWIVSHESFDTEDEAIQVAQFMSEMKGTKYRVVKSVVVWESL